MTSPNYQSLAKRRILLAEDVEMNQQLARHMMQGWGIEVDIAANGKVALGLVEQSGYDLVLMDIHMPEMDGMEATRHIRLLSDPSRATVPIVALTANALKGDRERYLEAGMNDYLSKPFNEADLFRIISKNLTNMTTTETAMQTSLLVNGHGTVNNVLVQDKLYNLKMIQDIAEWRRVVCKTDATVIPRHHAVDLAGPGKETGQQNWQQVGKLAHKLKSTVDSMNIVQLKEVIRQIEQQGKKAENIDQLPIMVIG